MKTSVRWRTNRSAFSSSLFAHGLGGVEVLRIGGLGCVGFVRVLIEFQREWSEDFNLETVREGVIPQLVLLDTRFC